METWKEGTMDAKTEIRETIKGTGNEGTYAPYWLILDPKQNMRCDIAEMANSIRGPFFSREDAESHLRAKAHRFSCRAKVYCLSGYYSSEWSQLWELERRNNHENKEVKG